MASHTVSAVVKAAKRAHRLGLLRKFDSTNRFARTSVREIYLKFSVQYFAERDTLMLAARKLRDYEARDSWGYGNG